jgi:hypothetical protein
VLTPPLYAALRASLPSSKVSFGCGGLQLFDLSEIEGAQVGYSIARDGTALCNEGDGAWRPNWIVIGYETACGDPLFVDISDPALPVFTATHGAGPWAPVAVSISWEAFLASLKVFAEISVSRGNPVELNAKPLSDDERNKFLADIFALNNSEITMDFWDVLLAG